MGKLAFVTNVKPTRTDATLRAYLKGGFVLLARARKTMTGARGDVVDAFRALFEDSDLVYRPATTRLYQQQVKAVIARKLSDGKLSKERAISGFADIKALLIARRGPCPKRTSRGKLKSGTYAEFRKIVGDFARRSRLPGGLDRTDTVLSILVKVGPYVGLRPCEWLHATIVGHNLNVLNAKSGNGRALGLLRVIELSQLPLKIITLVSHLIRQVRLLFAEAGSNWRKILGRLGERLARVCARIGVRRWSLYTARHVAIANWKRAGLSDAEIAALAGHSSTRTARQHYAGGRHGWTAEFASACADPDLVAGIVAHNGVTTVPLSPKSESVNVVPAHAVTPANIFDAPALPAAIPRHVIVVDKPCETLPIISLIEHDVGSAPSWIDSNWASNDAPAFGMG
jgi:integrase